VDAELPAKLTTLESVKVPVEVVEMSPTKTGDCTPEVLVIDPVILTPDTDTALAENILVTEVVEILPEIESTLVSIIVPTEVVEETEVIPTVLEEMVVSIEDETWLPVIGTTSALDIVIGIIVVITLGITTT
jgi:hypothetical protein